MISIKNNPVSIPCKICGTPSSTWGKAVILGRYNIQYYRCGKCEFIQTEDPFWLEEAYSTAITKSDIGLIGRNISLSTKTRNLILACLNP